MAASPSNGSLGVSRNRLESYWTVHVTESPAGSMNVWSTMSSFEWLSKADAGCAHIQTGKATVATTARPHVKSFPKLIAPPSRVTRT